MTQRMEVSNLLQPRPVASFLFPAPAPPAFFPFKLTNLPLDDIGQPKQQPSSFGSRNVRPPFLFEASSGGFDGEVDVSKRSGIDCTELGFGGRVLNGEGGAGAS
jgi:hypothetical protein